MISLIDAHCHLSFKDYPAEEINGVLDRAAESGVSAMINVGGGEGFEGNNAALELARQYPHIYATVGIHPHDASIVTPEIIAQIETLAADPKVVAIGEIGLDYHYEHSPKDSQEKVFADFLSLAARLNKPIMIHDRGADDRTFDLLKENKFPGEKTMIHCFTGTPALAQKYLDYGCTLSFTGIITFKKAVELREVVKLTPMEKLFVETDSPYLTPEPHRGRKNEPAYVKLVAQKVAEIKGLSFEEVAKMTTANVNRFFGL